MKLIIDLFSKKWVHNDFNIEFVNKVASSDDVIAGLQGADYLTKLTHFNVLEIKGPMSFISLILKIFKSNEVIFLVLLNKYIPLAILCRIFGKKVSYVIHKYNLTTRLRHKFVNFLYQFIELIGIYSISLEEPYEIFRKNIILNIDMWEKIDAIKPTHKCDVKKIAFVGKPSPGKNFEMLLSVAAEIGIEVIVYSDEFTDVHDCTVKPFSADITECDLIWGYYEPRYYKGIQSGLCYPALVNGLKIITNENIGFIFFSSRYPEYLLELSSKNDICKALKE